MDTNFKELLEEFKKIANKKWIKCGCSGHGNVGLTFENALNKKADTNYTPDYKNIEIKCTTRYSRFPISLFSVAFDGPTDKEIIRLNETYGTFDKDFEDKKTLIKKVRTNSLAHLKSGYYMNLLIEDDKLFLCVYDENNKLIEKEAYIYLETIKTHLLTKLKQLAIVKASKKKINNTEFFRYYKINLYLLKNFETFFKLLKNGNIEASIISRISKSGINDGKYYNKNIVFKIKKENINKLFDEIYYLNSDYEEDISEIQFL